ncbi:hypothetical protein PHLGIDRAFT_120887 [Phlebiopsis gigantea 11061_1 CR5-6]|uniref:Scytalone dehydratase-like protein Arp1 N-terminal domain-containing protein n=1 Tax=Phlebiopsis gigantea (strain 11061_1 CR5-6) TaxID=745531 RepID=A0A0C3RTV9_PHLG1|nr:hypothetical protein PHLGIDRAFT_120887 [Phlebiopsis gigantea 11061_1 CR5-6]
MQLLSKVLLFLTVAGLGSARAQISPAGTTLVVGEVSYFVPGAPVAQLSLVKTSKAFKSSGSLVPFTFINPSGRSFSTHDLSAVIAENSASDDVWSTKFLTGVYISSKSVPKLSPGNGTDVILSASEAPLSGSIPPGPYVVETATGKVFEVWRLYSDENQAFLYGTIPDGKGGFSQLSAHVDGASTVSVAVPSRLYFTPTAKQPLAGARIAVKDIFDVKGLRTGCGNRAFYSLYPAKNATAPAIQRYDL